MADKSGLQLSVLKSDTDIIISKEPSLSQNEEEDTASKHGSSDDVKDNQSQSPEYSHKRRYTDDAIKQAVEKGNLEVVTDWLATLPEGEERKAELNKVKYKYIYELYDGTLLNLAAFHNQAAVARLLLDEGSDPNRKDSLGRNALHVAATCSDDDCMLELVKLLIERNCNINESDHDQNTPIHYATISNCTGAVMILLDEGAAPYMKNSDGQNALHVACSSSTGVDIVKLLIERICNIDETDAEEKTPLHLAAIYNHPAAVRMLIEKGADPNKKYGYNRNALFAACQSSYGADVTEVVKILVEGNCNINEKDDYLNTPLHVAAINDHAGAVRILLENNADSTERNKADSQPIHNAVSEGNQEMVSVLMEHGATIDSKALDIALRRGYEDIVKQFMKTAKWPLLMRHTFTNWREKNKETTPFREMVKKMPDVAEEILNKCIVKNPKYQNSDRGHYSLAFNYEFVEDTRDEGNKIDESDPLKLLDREIKGSDKCEYGCDYDSVVYYFGEEKRERRNYTTYWGPVGFKKDNHPLAIMVKHKRLKLLTHPLVGSLLHHKWNRFGQYGYFINLLTYCVFLVSLTTFALIIENPGSQSCLTVSMNMSSTEINCSISKVRQSFIYISAIVVLIFSVGRLILEGVQLKIQFPHYFMDWINWMEVTQYVCSIIFVCVFGVDCLCPLTWQWQIGVVAVFLGWIDLIVFISKFPLTGIYVLMFIKILTSFIKILILSALLVFAFGLTFYLTFTQPEILRSPFSTPGRSLLKILTMTTGELDFDSIFRQDPAGGSDDAEEVPFPTISFMLWIVFIIIMPILLTNMLVGLAVGDIEAVQDEAALKKLALQVEQVLTVEEYLPRKWRRRFTCGYKLVESRKKISWRKRILFLLWGGERYNTRESIDKVLHPHESEDKIKTDKMLQEFGDLKVSVYDENKKMQTKNNQVLQEIEDLKTSFDDELKEVQRKNEEVLHEVEALKKSVDDMKTLLKQFVDSMESK